VSKVLAFIVAWVVAAGVSLAVAWQGVAIVGDQVTARRPAPLSATEIKSQVQDENQGQAGATTTTVAGAADSSGQQGPAVESPAPTAKPQASSPPRFTPAPTTIPNQGDDGGRTSGDDGRREQQPPPSTTTTAPAAAPQPTTRTYNLVGGSVSLKFSSSGVTVNWANPNAGYGVSVEPEDGNGVKVEFESDSHRSRVDGWWANGPQDRVREEAR
jgi:hypothetical protein